MVRTSRAGVRLPGAIVAIVATVLAACGGEGSGTRPSAAPATWGVPDPSRIVVDPVSALRAALPAHLQIVRSRKGAVRPFRREAGEGLEIVISSKEEVGPDGAIPKVDPNFVELHVMPAAYRADPDIDPKEYEVSPRVGIADVVAVTGDAKILFWGNESLARAAARILVVP